MRKIVLPLEETERSLVSLQYVKKHFSPSQAEIIIVMADESLGISATREDEILAMSKVEQKLELIKNVLGEYKVITKGFVAKAGSSIVRVAREYNADYVVMTKSSKPDMLSMIGKTTEYVLNNAPCNVIIVSESKSTAGEYKGLIYKKAQAVVNLRGQIGDKQSECLLPSVDADCNYHFEVTVGKIRFFHTAYNPETSNWDLPPTGDQLASTDVCAGETADILVKANSVEGKADRIRIINRGMKQEAVFTYKITAVPTPQPLDVPDAPGAMPAPAVISLDTEAPATEPVAEEVATEVAAEVIAEPAVEELVPVYKDVVEPEASEDAFVEPVMEEVSEEAVAEEAAEALIEETVVEEAAEEVAEETAAEESVQEAVEEVAEETVVEETAEEVVEETVAEEAAEEVVTEEAADDTVVESIVEETAEEVAVEEPVAEEVTEATEDSIFEPLAEVAQETEDEIESLEADAEVFDEIEIEEALDLEDDSDIEEVPVTKDTLVDFGEYVPEEAEVAQIMDSLDDELAKFFESMPEPEPIEDIPVETLQRDFDTLINEFRTGQMEYVEDIPEDIDDFV